MSFVFMVFHYPEPRHRDALRAGMRELGERTAFEALGLDLPAEGTPPAGERAPRRRFLLEAA